MASLAPLDPDRFLRWSYEQDPVHRFPWESPLTLDDVAFMMPETPLEELRRAYVGLAARVRRNQRLGLDPFDHIHRP